VLEPERRWPIHHPEQHRAHQAAADPKRRSKYARRLVRVVAEAETILLLLFDERERCDESARHKSSAHFIVAPHKISLLESLNMKDNYRATPILYIVPSGGIIISGGSCYIIFPCVYIVLQLAHSCAVW
jgi:hypothetical protein